MNKLSQIKPLFYLWLVRKKSNVLLKEIPYKLIPFQL
jgi:hypothetical protein